MPKFWKINLNFEVDKRKARVGLLAVAALFVLFLLVLGVYSAVYAKKVFAHQYLGETNLGGKSKGDLATLIGERIKTYSETPIELKNTDKSKSYTITPAEIGVTFDAEKTVNEIWGVGRNGQIWADLIIQAKTLFVKENHQAVYTLSVDSLNTKIQAIASELDHPEKDFSLVYKSGKFELVTDLQAGERIDQNEIVVGIRSGISGIKAEPISFSLKSYKPQIDPAKAAAALEKANKILAVGPLTLKYESQTFAADTDMIAGFLGSQGNGDNLDIVTNDDRIKVFVDSIGSSIDVASKNAKLSIQNGKAVVFQASQTGLKLDRVQTLADIKSAVLSRSEPDIAADIALKVEAKKPEINEGELSNLGINELIGTATTDFRTSPSNRVHNITIGAGALNGVIIAPGEEFSTLSHLGVIDASTGYLEELVIKNNKTLPDFGGGLCQVSSTLFRATLNAGMKITERQNHSYRVSYYEPPIGMDATIFDPAPDFKFVNNYASHVLIQSKIVGTKITFEFYGTKDARTIEISIPTGYDYVEPPAPVYTETDTLAPGEKKLVSHSHQGASANFHYKVTSSTGEVLQDKTFNSVYVALAEQWLIGKAVPAPAPTPTCTDATQNGDETGVDCGGSCPNACS